MSKKRTVEEMEKIAEEQKEMVSCKYCKNNIENKCIKGNTIQKTGICRLYKFNAEKWRNKQGEYNEKI